MANPQLEDGYIRIANEIWEALSTADFTASERRVLDLVLRLSYGCQKKWCYVKNWNQFETIGIRKSNIKKVLESLERANVLNIDWNMKIFSFNKDHTKWRIRIVDGYDSSMYDNLVNGNIKDGYPEITKLSGDNMKGNTEITKLSGDNKVMQNYNKVISADNRDATSSPENTDRYSRLKTDLKDIDLDPTPARACKEVATVDNSVDNSEKEKEFSLSKKIENAKKLGFEMCSIYEMCNPTAESHLELLLELQEKCSREEIFTCLDELKEASISKAERLDWMFERLVSGKEQP